MIENVGFELFIGDTYCRDFVVKNFPEKINEIYFTVKKNNKDKRFELQKRLNNGITLVDEDETSKTYNLLLEPEDTDNLKTETNYEFDIKLISDSNPVIKKTIITGTFVLKDHTTKKYNEKE